MTRRLLALIVLAAALVVPSASLADDGGNGSAPVAGARAGHAGAFLDQVSQRLDKRFQVFSSHCLVQNAPEMCAKVANRFAHRLGKLEAVLAKVEGKIKEKCAVANPPAKCSMSGEVIARIDTLLATIAGDAAKIKAAFPNAGSSS